MFQRRKPRPFAIARVGVSQYVIVEARFLFSRREGKNR